MPGAGRKSQGRRKIEMKPIQGESDRMVAFSKRRKGLFKKASELATLCGVEIVIIIFSLSGKCYTFGSPSVEAVLDRFSKENYIDDEQPDDHRVAGLARTRREARIKDLDQELDEINEKLAAEKERGQRLQQTTESFNSYVDSLDVNGLKHLLSKLEMLQEQVKPPVAVETPPSEPEAEPEPCKEDEENEDEASAIPGDWLKL